MRSAAGFILLAAGCLAPPPGVDPVRSYEPEDSLAKAAACLDRGDDASAVTHLTEHVNRHPDEVMTRAMLAELLYRLNRYPVARSEFDRVVADAQLTTGKPYDHLVHCHTRLMQIAEADDDPYAEHLHRGIGLILLVKQWDADPAMQDEATAEATLVKAVKALKTAREWKPAEPRIELYLTLAYDRLGVRSAARVSHVVAATASPFGLSPGERQIIGELRIRRDKP